MSIHQLLRWAILVTFLGLGSSVLPPITVFSGQPLPVVRTTYEFLIPQLDHANTFLVHSIQIQCGGLSSLLTNVIAPDGQTVLRSALANFNSSLSDSSLVLMEFDGSVSVADMKAIRVASTRGPLLLYNISIVPHLRFSFAPNVRYHYHIRGVSSAATFPANPGWSQNANVQVDNRLSLDFDVIALPITYELGLVTIAISIQNSSIECSSSQSPIVARYCQSQLQFVQNLPPVFISQQPKTGEFVSVFVNASAASKPSYAWEAAAFLIRLLDWGIDAPASNRSSDVSDTQLDAAKLEDGDEWSRVVFHPRLMYPVTYRYRYQSGIPAAFIETNMKIEIGEDLFETPSNHSHWGCISAQVDDEPDDSNMADIETFNGTTVTCFSSQGPLYSRMHHRGLHNASGTFNQSSFYPNISSLSSPQFAVKSHTTHTAHLVNITQSSIDWLMQAFPGLVSSEIRVSSQDLPPLIPIPDGFANQSWSIIHLHERPLVTLDQQKVIQLMQPLLADQKNATFFLEYRAAVHAAGDQGVEMVRSVLANGSFPQFFNDTNITSTFISPLLDLQPPSRFAPSFLTSLASNESLSLQVRSMVIRSCLSLECPDQELYSYLLFLVNSTSENDTDSSLWDEAANALAVFANRSDCTLSLMQRLGTPLSILDAVQSAAAFWEHDKLMRFVHIPCPSGQCSGAQTRAVLFERLRNTTEPSEIPILINAIANIGDSQDVDFFTNNFRSGDILWNTAMIRAVRRLLPQQAILLLLPAATHSGGDMQLTAIQSLTYLASKRRNCASEYFHDVSTTLSSTLLSSSFGDAVQKAWVLFFQARVSCGSLNSRSSEDFALLQYFNNSGTSLSFAATKFCSNSSSCGLNDTLTDPVDPDYDVNWLFDRPQYSEVNAIWDSTQSTHNLKFGGNNANALVYSKAGWSLSEDGLSATLIAGLDVSLFDYQFTVMDAGVTTAWSSLGHMSLTMWFTVYAPVRGVGLSDYDILLTQLTYDSKIEIVAGSKCDLTVPPANRGFNWPITVFTASFIYGIPLLADVDVQLAVTGGFQIEYGPQVVLTGPSSATDFNFSTVSLGIKGYVKPVFELQTQLTASANLLLLSGDINALLNLATVSAPAVAMYTSDSSAGDRPLGYDISLDSSFLKGEVNLHYSLFSCCCPHWYSCGCGGSCNIEDSISLFSWPGYVLPSQTIVHRSIGGCDESAVVSNNNDTVSNETVSVSLIWNNNSLPDSSDESQFDNDFCNAGYLRSTFGMSCDRLIGTKVCFAYDFGNPNPSPPSPSPTGSGSGGFPLVGMNSLCAFWFRDGKWNKKSNKFDAQIFKFKSTYRRGGSKSNRRLSIGDLEGYGLHKMDLDEFPMASMDDGGCFARVQAIAWYQNQRQGIQWGACMNKLIPKKADKSKQQSLSVTVDFSHIQRIAKSGKIPSWIDQDFIDDPRYYCCKTDERLCQNQELLEPYSQGTKCHGQIPAPKSMYAGVAKIVKGRWTCSGQKLTCKGHP